MYRFFDSKAVRAQTRPSHIHFATSEKIQDITFRQFSAFQIKYIKNKRDRIDSKIMNLTSDMQLTFVLPFFLLSGAAALTACSCCLGFFSWFRSLGVHYHLYIFLFSLLHCFRDSGYPTKKENIQREKKETERERERRENELRTL